jgi:hypothetical protein
MLMQRRRPYKVVYSTSPLAEQLGEIGPPLPSCIW